MMSNSWIRQSVRSALRLGGSPWPLTAPGLSRSPQLQEEDSVALKVPFASTPFQNLAESHPIAYGDRYRCRKALPVVPMKKSREPIPAGVGCRECQSLCRAAAPQDWPDLEIIPDSEGPAWELDEEENEPMNVAVALALEAKRRESAVQIFRRAWPNEHEVRVERLVLPARVQIRTSPAGEHGSNPGPPQGIADPDSHVGQRGSCAELQRGLPDRRGRRRRPAARVRRSTSDSRSCSR